MVPSTTPRACWSVSCTRRKKAAGSGARSRSWRLQALAHEAQGDTSLALASLERAMSLAEPEGYVRVFVSEGPQMARLLQEAAFRG